MIPNFCRVKHDPDNGLYGDCVRACVASILNKSASEQVPHFYHDGPDGGFARMRAWLLENGLAPFMMNYPGDASRAEVLEHMGMQNPDGHYMLFGCVEGGGQHVVVCEGGKVVHDPAWYSVPIVGPGHPDMWQLMVIARA